jgi:hypothetical protein
MMQIQELQISTTKREENPNPARSRVGVTHKIKNSLNSFRFGDISHRLLRMSSNSVPVTVFTGFLGSGKTTLILCMSLAN